MWAQLEEVREWGRLVSGRTFQVEGAVAPNAVLLFTQFIPSTSWFLAIASSWVKLKKARVCLWETFFFFTPSLNISACLFHYFLPLPPPTPAKFSTIMFSFSLLPIQFTFRVVSNKLILKCKWLIKNYVLTYIRERHIYNLKRNKALVWLEPQGSIQLWNLSIE